MSRRTWLCGISSVFGVIGVGHFFVGNRDGCPHDHRNHRQHDERPGVVDGVQTAAKFSNSHGHPVTQIGRDMSKPALDPAGQRFSDSAYHDRPDGQADRQSQENEPAS